MESSLDGTVDGVEEGELIYLSDSSDDCWYDDWVDEDEEIKTRRSNVEMSLLSYMGSNGKIKYTRAKRIKVLVEGDKFFPAKDITVNKNRMKEVRNVLEEISRLYDKEKRGSYGVFQCLYDAKSGNVVEKLDDIEDAKEYVAARRKIEGGNGIRNETGNSKKQTKSRMVLKM